MINNATVRICLFLLFLSTSCFLLQIYNHPKQIPLSLQLPLIYLCALIFYLCPVVFVSMLNLKLMKIKFSCVTERVLNNKFSKQCQRLWLRQLSGGFFAC